MPLLKDGRMVDDPWVAVADDGAPPVAEQVIVTLERWRESRDRLLQRNGRLGIRLRSDQSPALIADDLAHFDLVALEFPVFRDGRAFSYARLLRERHGFTGEVRATGDLLRDQFVFMQRCGFDAFEVADHTAVEGWRQAMAEISVWYQPAGDRRPWVGPLRHRRPPPASGDRRDRSEHGDAGAALAPTLSTAAE